MTHNYILLLLYIIQKRKKQARSNKQTRQSNTAHPTQGSEKTASGGTRTHDTLYMYMYMYMYNIICACIFANCWHALIPLIFHVTG